MEQRPDILHFLKEHSTPPPPEVEGKVLQIPERQYADRFQQLQEHAVQPPADLAAGIRSVALSRKGRVRLMLIGAAAAVVAVLAGVFLFRSESVRRQKSEAATAGRDRQSRSGGHSGTDSALLAGSAPAEHTETATLSANHPLPLELLLAGDKYPLSGNSLLATFTSFRYPILKRSLISKDADNGWRVHLDAYTSIYLSRTMVATLRKLYSRRTDGSPAREAMKTKNKLERWSLQDGKQFDLRYIGSPLDPIDLADFLFPPLLSFGRQRRDSLPSVVPSPPVDTLQVRKKPSGESASLTVSYSLQLQTGRSNNGIGETYNGGLQTIFDDGSQARLRLATLMRIESIFADHKSRTFTIVTESGKSRSPVTLTDTQWATYNKKYVGATCALSDDTVSILGYPCRRADILLHNGRHITAWYSPSIRVVAQAMLEPAFAQVPGLVLRYEYTLRRKTVRYDAINLSRKPIDPAVFVIPGGR